MFLEFLKARNLTEKITVIETATEWLKNIWMLWRNDICWKRWKQVSLITPTNLLRWRTSKPAQWCLLLSLCYIWTRYHDHRFIGRIMSFEHLGARSTAVSYLKLFWILVETLKKRRGSARFLLEVGASEWIPTGSDRQLLFRHQLRCGLSLLRKPAFVKVQLSCVCVGLSFPNNTSKGGFSGFGKHGSSLWKSCLIFMVSSFHLGLFKKCLQFVRGSSLLLGLVRAFFFPWILCGCMEPQCGVAVWYPKSLQKSDPTYHCTWTRSRASTTTWKNVKRSRLRDNAIETIKPRKQKHRQTGKDEKTRDIVTGPSKEGKKKETNSEINNEGEEGEKEGRDEKGELKRDEKGEGKKKHHFLGHHHHNDKDNDDDNDDDNNNTSSSNNDNNNYNNSRDHGFKRWNGRAGAWLAAKKWCAGLGNQRSFWYFDQTQIHFVECFSWLLVRLVGSWRSFDRAFMTSRWAAVATKGLSRIPAGHPQETKKATLNQNPTNAELLVETY